MIWIRLCLTCVFSVGLAGSIAYLGNVFVQSRWQKANPYLVLLWDKIVLVLYWAPIPFIWICLSRMNYADGNRCYTGEFICSTFPLMTKLFNYLGGIWLVGFFFSALAGICKVLLVKNRMRGNVRVENRRYVFLFEEYKKRFDIRNIELYQNDLLLSPITYGVYRKKIILPFENYTEKQLRIIFEHEMNHIRRGDLWWRMFALVTARVHWFNPMPYMHIRQIIYHEEVVCDEISGKGKEWYSLKEYVGFLAEVADNKIFCISAMALCETQNETIRRIEAMIRNKEIRKPEKRMMIASSMILVLISLLPATYVSAKTAEVQEEWIHATEKEMVLEASDWSDDSDVVCSVDEGAIEEVDLSSDIMPYSNTVSLNQTINGNTRVLYQAYSMSQGGKITIVATCNDSSVSYRIGIKNRDTGDLYSISGKGTLSKTFEIPVSGSYSAYVENTTSSTIKVEGCAVYD